jgi:hypothetical protein
MGTIEKVMTSNWGFACAEGLTTLPTYRVGQLFAIQQQHSLTNDLSGLGLS